MSEGRKHDVTIARRVSIPRGSIAVLDRGNNDYKLFASWIENGIYFVTRMKDNADYTVAEERITPRNLDVLWDQLIQFNGYYTHKNCPHLVRKVTVWDNENDRVIVVLTNHLKLRATTISRIYKGRWQIELFFRPLKQNFEIKPFVVTTKTPFTLKSGKL